MADAKSLIDRAADQVAATWLDTRTEQALLGALLLDPDQLLAVKPWLRDSDFFDAHHQLIFRTIDELVSGKVARTFGTHHQLTLRTIDKLVTARAFFTCEELTMSVHDRVARYGIDAIYLHTLLRACPQPSNAIAYGHMVIQADARRAVARYTVRLAETIVPVKDGRLPLSEVLDAAALIGHLAHTLKTRTRSQPGSDTLDLPAPAPLEPSAERIDLDDRLLASLISFPHDIPEVTPLLNSADFATRRGGNLFDLLVTMHDASSPIDILTVMWAAHQAGILDAGESSSQDCFERLDKVPSDATVVLAVDIQHAATLDHATTVASALTTALADHRIPTSQILHLAASQANALQQRHLGHTNAYQAPDDRPRSTAHNTSGAPTI